MIIINDNNNNDGSTVNFKSLVIYDQSEGERNIELKY